MGRLRDRFEHFYAPDEDAVKTAIETGMFTPDTNILLHLYRFQAGARDELFGALEALGERLWIPHQVGLEFHRRRLDVIKEQEDYFAKTPTEIKALIGGLREKVEAFPTRIGLNRDRVKEILDSIGTLSNLLHGEVAKAKAANEVRAKDHASDKVFERLDSLLGNRIGEPMTPAELKEAREEARKRVEAKIPPGFEDSNKADPTGDYLIFRQLMNEARERKLPVVFITDDEKRDWYRTQQGIPFGARAELREEMMAEAGVPLLIITTDTFLRHARKYLGFNVSDETIAQAEELPDIIEDDRPPLERYLARTLTDEDRKKLQKSGSHFAAILASMSDETRSALFGERRDALLNRWARAAITPELALRLLALQIAKNELARDEQAFLEEEEEEEEQE